MEGQASADHWKDSHAKIDFPHSKERIVPELLLQDVHVYKIRKGTDYNKYHNTFEDKEIEIIDRVLENFGTKKSRELELTSTIIFLNDNFKLDAQELKHEIIKIKPKFSEKEIDAAQMELKNLGYYSYKK